MKKIFTLFAVLTASLSLWANGTENNHEFVDLGLSVKWANMNVGADSISAYGNYYAWGELVANKDTFYWNNYKYCNSSYYALTKYCTISSYGKVVDNKTTLEPADDAASVHWGGSWRMPTSAEWGELCDNCTWTWTTIGKVNGYQVTAQNGNSIFLPAAGFVQNTNPSQINASGCYWSSSLVTLPDYPNKAISMFFAKNSKNYQSKNDRYLGYSVRPVCTSVSSVEEAQVGKNAPILLMNGRLYIRRGSTLYDLNGRKL